MRTFQIKEPCVSMRDEIQAKIDNLNKPLGSLGRLEEIALQVCLAEQSLSPTLRHPCHLLFGADHGIEREGVSASPREVTWQQMINFANGGGGVNMFCRQHGFKLMIVDVGVDYDLSGVNGIIGRKVARGTRNFLYEAALTEEELDKAVEVGVEMVDLCDAYGTDVISIGEMGVGNTSPSSVWMSFFGGLSIAECVGAGSGLANAGVRHKVEMLEKSVQRFLACNGESSDINIIRWFGGLEMVAAIGAMLRAAELHKIVLVDGFIMTACAWAAMRLYPDVFPYLVFAHQGDESGHALMLSLIKARPLLNLGLRLGEGTGALCAFPIVDSAVRMMNEMNNFDDAHITKYF